MTCWDFRVVFVGGAVVVWSRCISQAYAKFHRIEL